MTIEKAAIVGGGIIGRSWAVVFARAGVPVAVYDHSLEGRAALPARFADIVAESAALCGDEAAQAATLARIIVADNLAKAVADADFIHECIDEKLDSKRAIFLELDRLTKSSAILATTTSSFPVSTFASELPGRSRCIVVHPATPPHLLPVTEICPAPFTYQAVTQACFAFIERCGQAPVLIRFEQPNFVLNRMQAALVVEMLRCLNTGIISAGDIDKIISQGFGLRWAFLGPFEGVDLNAAGGIREYLTRFGFIFDDVAKQNGHDGPVVTPEAIDMLEAYTRAQLPIEALGGRISWRDRSIVALRQLKEANPSLRV
jgi:L-gulonate 3-dehydrogenase